MSSEFIFSGHPKIAGTLLSLIWAVVSPLFVKALYEIPSNYGSIMISIQLHLQDQMMFKHSTPCSYFSRFEPHSLSLLMAPSLYPAPSGSPVDNSMIRRQRQFRQLLTYLFLPRIRTPHETLGGDDIIMKRKSPNGTAIARNGRLHIAQSTLPPGWNAVPSSSAIQLDSAMLPVLIADVPWTAKMFFLRGVGVPTWTLLYLMLSQLWAWELIWLLD